MMRPATTRAALGLLALLALAACSANEQGGDVTPGIPYPDALNPRGYMLNDGTIVLFRELPPGMRR
jgi:hypothetical protein